MGWTSLANRVYKLKASRGAKDAVAIQGITEGLINFSKYIADARAERKRVAGEIVDTSINTAGIPASHVPEISSIMSDIKDDIFKSSRTADNKLRSKEKRQEAVNEKNVKQGQAVQLGQELELLKKTAKLALDQDNLNVDTSNYSTAAAEGFQTDLVKIAKGDWSDVVLKNPQTNQPGVFIKTSEDANDPNQFMPLKTLINKVGQPKFKATDAHASIVNLFEKVETTKAGWDTEKKGEWKKSATRLSLMQDLRAIIKDKDTAGSLAYDFGLEDLGVENTFINKYFRDTLSDEEFNKAYGKDASLTEEGQAEFLQFADNKKESFKSQDLTKPLTSYYENALDTFFEQSQGPVKAEDKAGTTKTPTEIIVAEDKAKRKAETNKSAFEDLESEGVGRLADGKYLIKHESGKYYYSSSPSKPLDPENLPRMYSLAALKAAEL